MKNMKTNLLRLGLILTFLFCDIVQAQGTLEEYRKSASVDTLFANKVYNSPRDFNWVGNNLMWYSTSTKVGKIYLLVSPEEKKQKMAFDHSLLAKSLSTLFGKKISANNLLIDSLDFSKDGSVFTFIKDTLMISCQYSNYELKVVETKRRQNQNESYWGSRDDQQSDEPISSPDELLSAYIKNSNLYIKNMATKEETQLSNDGSRGFYYTSNIQWSPDSKKIIAYKVRPGQEHKIYFVESSPSEQLQPKLQSRDYLKPGDELKFRSPQLFKIATMEHVKIPTDFFDSQYSISNFQWKENSSSFTFEYNQRGHQIYRVLKVDSESGEISILIEESSPTFIDYSGKKFRYDVKGKDEIIWASERDGWNQLYLYDTHTGKVKNKITTGNWPVREVLKVDDDKRQIYFTASGLDKGMDPYFLQYCRIDFDGKNFKRYTSEDGNHKVTFSPDYTYYVDQYSRVDMPAVSLLKEEKSAKRLMQFQKEDITDLLATGWKMPEVFLAKGRDGKTDIWGVIVRPTNFDPSKTYPIIEYIYAGPHDSFVPKDFHSYYSSMSSLAELGFIVVQIDGMGTSNRSKAFHDVAWKNLKDAGFPDRKLWINAAAKKYPYMNINKVGIYGTSAGGQSAGAALVFNSDFYDVAVSSAGCHDNRMDKIWWNEQWMGYPVGPQYSESSNIENASQMQGNLMLIVGELDDNVDPASTFQFADALIKADKDFELVLIPGAGHTSGGEYGDRKRKDFFVKHLLDVTPPSWNKIYN